MERKIRTIQKSKWRHVKEMSPYQIDEVFEKPYQKELNIKLRYIDEEELKAYRNENGTTKEG